MDYSDLKAIVYRGGDVGIWILWRSGYIYPRKCLVMSGRSGLGDVIIYDVILNEKKKIRRAWYCRC